MRNLIYQQTREMFKMYPDFDGVLFFPWLLLVILSFVLDTLFLPLEIILSLFMGEN